MRKKQGSSTRYNNSKLQKVFFTLRSTCEWLYKLRSVALAIPVAACAVILAIHNEARLPALVGIDLQASGEYAHMVARELVVLGPLAVTALSLLLMFCSRRVLYPWLISLFSLALPLLIYFTNVFPG